MKFGWVTINVRNMEESLAFYRDIAGLTVHRSMKPMPGTEIVFLGIDGQTTEVELICNDKNASPSHGKDISIGFEVDSLDRQMETLRSHRLTIAGPFQPGPTIRFIYVDDPNGVKVQFFQNLHDK